MFHDRKAILFDWDLTLVHAMPVVKRGMRKIAEKYGLDFSHVTMKDMYCDWEGAIDALYEENKNVLPDRKDFSREVADSFADGHKGLELTYESLLRKLKESGYKMGLVTYNRYANVFSVLRKTDFHFDAYVTVEDMQPHGLKSIGITNAMKQLGVTAEESIYIGDTIKDIQSAHEVNVAVIAVTTGVYTREELMVEKPIKILDDLSEIEPLLL